MQDRGQGTATEDLADEEVVIAGCGPTGMVLAAELRLAGVDPLVIEPRASNDLEGSRAGGLHARTLEVLDQRGVAERFLAEGQRYPFAGFAMIMLDMSDLPTRHPYVLGLWQSHIERLLAGWVDELAVRVERGVQVDGLRADDDGVEVQLSDGRTLRTRYLVGCDGGRSAVRRAAGIEFAGSDPTTSWMLAEVEMDVEPEMGVTRDELGMHAIGRREPDEPIRLVLTEAGVPGGTPGLDELRTALVGIYGTDFGLRSASFLSRFTDVSRQAVQYRSGRVLLAGDAAHVHPPQGGQGLNTGVQDAVNLGWKLARVVRGLAPDTLLDSYHAERHPVGARVLHNTAAQVALGGPGERHQALRDTMGELLALDEPRRHVAAMVTGLDIAYDLGGEHRLVGRRMPDLDLQLPDGTTTRVAELLHDAVPLLLDLRGTTAPPPEVADGADLRVLAATSEGPWLLPLLGEVPAPDAVLVRPDGHVAWVGALEDPSLQDAVDRWFGRAS
jgi:3-(3-hydroxy-phenyl)propionate hydroxylase